MWKRWPVLKMTVCSMSCTHFNLLFSRSRIHLEQCLRNLSLPSDFRTLHHLHWKEMQPARLRWKTDVVAAPLIQSTNPQPSLSVRKKVLLTWKEHGVFMKGLGASEHSAQLLSQVIYCQLPPWLDCVMCVCLCRSLKRCTNFKQPPPPTLIILFLNYGLFSRESNTLSVVYNIS